VKHQTAKFCARTLRGTDSMHETARSCHRRTMHAHCGSLAAPCVPICLNACRMASTAKRAHRVRQNVFRFQHQARPPLSYHPFLQRWIDGCAPGAVTNGSCTPLHEGTHGGKLVRITALIRYPCDKSHMLETLFRTEYSGLLDGRTVCIQQQCGGMRAGKPTPADLALRLATW
jgi:hypothetical protein